MESIVATILQQGAATLLELGAATLLELGPATIFEIGAATLLEIGAKYSTVRWILHCAYLKREKRGHYIA